MERVNCVKKVNMLKALLRLASRSREIVSHVSLDEVDEALKPEFVIGAHFRGDCFLHTVMTSCK